MKKTDDIDWKTRCEGLELQIERLKLERQNLLEQVARERQRADALFVAYPQQAKNEPPPDTKAPHVPQPMNVLGPTDPPLRYQVADAVNQVFKKVLPGAHKLVRNSTSAQEK